MADETKLVTVKIDDDIDPENFDYREKSDDEKNVDVSGLISDDDFQGDPDDDDSDTAELLSGKKKTPPFWTFEYYQTFFDIDTSQVLKRILGSMVPVKKRNFLTTQIRSNPDLYGPFWICVTLVVTIAITGNLASYLVHVGEHKWSYNFHKITLAAVAVFGYAWLVPIFVWAVLTWRGNTAAYSFLEIICVYGYSLSIFVPISILWVIPLELVRWILVVVGLCLSGAVLVLTFWSAVRDDDKKVAFIILLIIFLLHASLAVGFKLYFFHSPPSIPKTSNQKSTAKPFMSHTVAKSSILTDVTKRPRKDINKKRNAPPRPRVTSTPLRNHAHTLKP
ncbi:protein YIPF1-like [Xenia sp. Carnegie-2017]|uniref:protein YIPF1-like n=1 Tax=Xenia sp. Carnegie-2017 TaxID=2897299 RepID=UPI001F03D57D|nr:protein YIPF1-like [Xenia sp. Carnegie-2017]